MVLQRTLDGAVLSLIALINVEVFGAYIEVLLLSLSKVHTVSVDLLSSIASATDRCLFSRGRCRVRCIFDSSKEVECRRINERSGSPTAHLAIVTDTHDRVLVMIADNTKAVDGILMTVLGQATLLDGLGTVLAFLGASRDRLFLCSDIPLK